MKELLIIEDSENDAALLRRALDFFGIANPIRSFSNGQDALAHLSYAATVAPIAGPTVAIVFVDLILPGMSGLQILEAIAAQPAFEKTLRIVLTNLHDIETIKRSYALGANSFLIKPIQAADLRELIKNFPGHWAFALEPADLPVQRETTKSVLVK